jgi:two-component system nitrate/nitrite response regulator NarL
MTNEPNPIRIVIADDQPIFPQCLRRSLEAEGGLYIVGEASDAPGAVKLIRQLKPDILLFGLALRPRLELNALNSLASYLSAVRVVAMVTALEKRQILQALRLGAHGIVLKTSEPPLMLKSIRSVMAGNYWLEGVCLEILVETLRPLLPQVTVETPLTDFGLTTRELATIAKIACGHSNRQIAHEFAISERTVKHHLTNIFSKLAVSSRLELAMFAVHHHLIENAVLSSDWNRPPADATPSRRNIVLPQALQRRPLSAS